MSTSAFTERELAIVRRAYAKQMLVIAGVDDPRLEEVFATEPRERYLGPPPWRIARFGGYRVLPSSDPVLAYQDTLFALSPERGVNNGSPALHAHWLHQAQLKPGERVAHLGAGTGYYTALIARMVGKTGHVTAIECDPRLASLAKENLAAFTKVMVIDGDAAKWPRDDTDCVYVNFGVGRPTGAWLDRLRPGGRLVFPLGVPGPHGNARQGRNLIHGAGFRVERRNQNAFAVRWLGPAFFVCVEGEGDVTGTDAERETLKAAFERGGVEFVRSLVWRGPPSPDRSWFVGSGWSLSYDEAV